MKTVLGIIVIVSIFMACGIASQYNQQNYPDSIIITMFERSNVNSEEFSRRVARAVQAEIAVGKFTIDQANEFIDEWKFKLQSGIEYASVAAVMDKYAKKFFLGDSGVSEAAILAYYMIAPDFTLLNISSQVGEQDVMVCLDFLNYVQDRINGRIMGSISNIDGIPTMARD